MGTDRKRALAILFVALFVLLAPVRAIDVCESDFDVYTCVVHFGSAVGIPLHPIAMLVSAFVLMVAVPVYFLNRRLPAAERPSATSSWPYFVITWTIVLIATVWSVGVGIWILIEEV